MEVGQKFDQYFKLDLTSICQTDFFQHFLETKLLTCSNRPNIRSTNLSSGKSGKSQN